MEKNEKIVFSTEEGDVEFYVLEQTMVSGTNYILVTDDLTAEEGSFLILKEVMMENPDSKEEITTYGVIEDEEELKAIIKVFDELLEDVDLEV
ncbi:MAG: DUF1292 domain-containing protein [Lachnospiraceae bacterium]|nr:DUF1292 domain-containing protein [Lachnospiraceae bacterium]